MNRFEDSDILTKTAELLDLPMDVVAGLPNLELLGDRQLFLSHHQGILSYSDTAIDVNCGALLVRALLEIDKPDDLILIQRQQNGSRLLMPLRAEGVDLRRIADPPASRWSRHSVTSKAFIFGICRL